MKKIFISCCCLGWLVTQAQSDIFKGGNGSGGQKLGYVQPSQNFWKGGDGDGFSTLKYEQKSASFWQGGDGDGYAKNDYSQKSGGIYLGGDGDGYTANRYVQKSIAFWNGGAGDGHADSGYTQTSVSFWKGGAGDGWASTYLPQTSLPVTWLQFNAENWLAKYSRLNWTTATEMNTAYFEIQRGSNAISFTTIGNLNAAGNSNSHKNYQFVDSLPESGYNYYRIKQVDKDGAFSYSPARLVRFSINVQNLVRIYPNPAADFIMVELPQNMRTENTIVNIIAANGSVVDHIRVPANSNALIRFQVRKLARGAYTVHINSQTQNLSGKLVLQ